MYLDAAGNVKQTAEQLCVHRTTVYYRLERIEKIAGVSLADGAPDWQCASASRWPA